MQLGKTGRLATLTRENYSPKVLLLHWLQQRVWKEQRGMKESKSLCNYLLFKQKSEKVNLMPIDILFERKSEVIIWTINYKHINF